jgi:hypothetical protein
MPGGQSTTTMKRFALHVLVTVVVSLTHEMRLSQAGEPVRIMEQQHDQYPGDQALTSDKNRLHALYEATIPHDVYNDRDSRHTYYRKLLPRGEHKLLSEDEIELIHRENETLTAVIHIGPMKTGSSRSIIHWQRKKKPMVTKMQVWSHVRNGGD